MVGSRRQTVDGGRQEEEEVKEVLKHLKNNVARDPLRYANELFNPKVAGDDLVKAITKLVNRIKTEQVFPECL